MTCPISPSSEGHPLLEDPPNPLPLNLGNPAEPSTAAEDARSGSSRAAEPQAAAVAEGFAPAVPTSEGYGGLAAATAAPTAAADARAGSSRAVEARAAALAEGFAPEMPTPAGQKGLPAAAAAPTAAAATAAAASPPVANAPLAGASISGDDGKNEKGIFALEVQPEANRWSSLIQQVQGLDPHLRDCVSAAIRDRAEDLLMKFCVEMTSQVVSDLGSEQREDNATSKVIVDHEELKAAVDSLALIAKHLDDPKVRAAN